MNSVWLLVVMLLTCSLVDGMSLPSVLFVCPGECPGPKDGPTPPLKLDGLDDYFFYHLAASITSHLVAMGGTVRKVHTTADLDSLSLALVIKSQLLNDRTIGAVVLDCMSGAIPQLLSFVEQKQVVICAVQFSDDASYRENMHIASPNVRYFAVRGDDVGFVAGAVAAAQTATKHILKVTSERNDFTKAIRAGFNVAVRDACKDCLIDGLHTNDDVMLMLHEMMQLVPDKPQVDLIVALGKTANEVAYQFANTTKVLAIGPDVYSLLYGGDDETTEGEERRKNYLGSIDVDQVAEVAKAIIAMAIGEAPTIPKVTYIELEDIIITPCERCNSTAAEVAMATRQLLISGAVNTSFDRSKMLLETATPSTTLQELSLLSGAMPAMSHPMAVYIWEHQVVGCFQMNPPLFVLYEPVARAIEMKPVLPINVEFPALAHTPNRLYFHGGERNGSLVGDLIVCNISTSLRVECGNWSEQLLAPSPRSRHILTGERSTLYTFGGKCENGLCADFWALEERTMGWVQLPMNGNYPSGRLFHAMAVWDADLTLFGNSDSLWVIVAGGRAESQSTALDVFMYAVKQQVWLSVGVSMSPRISPCLLTFGSRLLLIAGEEEEFTYELFEEAEATMLVFNANSSQWTLPVVYDPEPSKRAVCPVTGSGSHFLSALMLHNTDEGSVQFKEFIFALSNCLPQRTNNFVTAADGQGCIRCKLGTYGDNDQCLSCDSLLSENSEVWQRRYCAMNSGKGVIAIWVIIIIEFTVALAGYEVSVLYHKNKEMRRNVRAATELSEAVAQMRFGRATFLEKTGVESNRILAALCSCAHSLKLYRMFIPHPILNLINVAESHNAISVAERDEPVSTKASAVGSVLDPSFDLLSLGSDEDADEKKPQDFASGMISTRVLAALKCGISFRDLSALVTNVVGFHAWCDGVNLEVLTRRISKYTDIMQLTIDRAGGTVEALLGDKVIATWNVTQPSQQHFRNTVVAAYEITSNRSLADMGLKLCAGVATGTGRVGIVGCEHVKQHVVLSTAIGEATALASIAPKRNCDILFEWTATTNDLICDHFVFRILCAGKFFKAPPGTGRVPSPQSESRETLSLVAEILAPLLHRQWLYELRGFREHIETYNLVVRCVFLGKLDRAKDLTLKDMPRWYATELRQILNDGKLDCEEIRPFK